MITVCPSVIEIVRVESHTCIHSLAPVDTVLLPNPLGMPSSYHEQRCQHSSWARGRAPRDKPSFAALMTLAASCNRTLTSYVYPTLASHDVVRNWVPYTSGCSIATDCYCYHVKGDMSKSLNPRGWEQCAKVSTVGNCSTAEDRTRDCCCLHGKSCLFSDMRPTKILSVIAAARAAGVTRIVEEGRFGGLSAYMYALHGFEVISVEFLPLDGATAAIAALAPQIEMVTGDGAVLLPQLLTARDAARTMVIFDGEKRLGAYQTFEKVRANVALAVFDDSNVGPDFHDFTRALDVRREVWWDTRHPSFAPLLAHEAGAMRLLEPLRSRTIHGKQCHHWHGGVDHLQSFHFSIVRGGAWEGNHTYP